jgi:tetratricopeptide (TPR) repeat protein
MEDMRQRLTDAINLDLERGDRLGAARAANELALGLMNNRDDQEVAQFIAEQWPLYADLWPDPVAVDLKLVLARARGQAGDFPAALSLVDEALVQAERDNELRRVAAAMTVKGTLIASMNRLREGVALLEGAERLARDMADNDLLSTTLLLNGFYLNEIDVQQALPKYDEGFELAKRRGNRPQMLVLANNIVYTAFLSGDWERGLQVAGDAIAEAVARRPPGPAPACARRAGIGSPRSWRARASFCLVAADRRHGERRPSPEADQLLPSRSSGAVAG